MEKTVYTIGHSNLTADAFSHLLTRTRMQVLVDVRSKPGSSYAPWANRDDLPRMLIRLHIEYVYLGELLGGRPDDPNCYDSTGKPVFSEIFTRPFFKNGLDQLETMLDGRNVCIMCAEEDPGACHRHLLVGEGLRQRGVRLLHIRSSGQIQTDQDLWLEKTGTSENQLQMPL